MRHSMCTKWGGTGSPFEQNDGDHLPEVSTRTEHIAALSRLPDDYRRSIRIRPHQAREDGRYRATLKWDGEVT